MKIAVTGGSGRVGFFVAKKLVERGHDVTILDRSKPRESVARWRFVDLMSRTDVMHELEDFDAVAHLGEMPNIHAAPSPDEVFAHNAAVGSAVFQSCADLGVRRVVYSSSAQVYGAWGWPIPAYLELPVSEETPVQPTNAYGVSKVANERYLQSLTDTGQLRGIAMRLPWVRGAYWFPGGAWREWSLPKLTEPSDGFATYVMAEDCALAFALALESELESFEVFNIAAVDTLNLTPVREYIAMAYPKYGQLPEDWPALKSPLLIDKARRLLGWEPTQSAHDMQAEKTTA